MFLAPPIDASGLCLKKTPHDPAARLDVRMDSLFPFPVGLLHPLTDGIRWPVSRDAVRAQAIDALKAQEIKETGNEEARITL
jgi:hypothetical protein